MYNERNDERLCRVFNNWLTKHNLPPLSADEVQYELMCSREDYNSPVKLALIDYQVKWLQKFIDIWQHRVENNW